MLCTDDLEVVVVGAGAAGLGAAMRLAAARVSFTVLEARGTGSAAGPIRLLMRRFHSISGAAGCIRLIVIHGPKLRPRPVSQSTRPIPPGALRASTSGSAPRIRRVLLWPRGVSTSVSRRLLPTTLTSAPQNFSNPMAVSTLSSTRSAAMSIELDLVSVQDSNRYADSGVNWRVVEGYGGLIAAQAAGLPIRLDCPVTLIDHRGKRLTIETALGTVMADAVILTIPAPLIAAQRTSFRPDLMDKVGAASVLPLGLADKLFMMVDMPGTLPVDGHLIGNPYRTLTGSYHLRPFGRPLIEAFFGGRLAHELEATGRGAFFDFAVAELTACSAATFAPACAHSLKPTGRAILSRKDHILTRFLAMPMLVPRSLRLWMGDSFLPVKPAHGTTSRRRMAHIRPVTTEEVIALRPRCSSGPSNTAVRL
jgi:monoamine oxidase